MVAFSNEINNYFVPPVESAVGAVAGVPASLYNSPCAALALAGLEPCNTDLM